LSTLGGGLLQLIVQFVEPSGLDFLNAFLFAARGLDFTKVFEGAMEFAGHRCSCMLMEDGAA
jgi:hypothetical protein